MAEGARISRTTRRAWVAGAVGYGVVRVVLAGAFVADYGLNIFVFAAVELSSSLALGMSTSRLAWDYLNPEATVRRSYVTIAIVAYLAPDAYVLTFASRMPARILTPVVVIVALGLAATVFRLRRGRSSATSGS